MKSKTERIQRAAVPRASLAIDNLRAIVILLVLAFHSVLAYLNFLPPQPFAFDQPPFLWRAFPIVDSQRWMGFDLFCAWLDVFLMSFFFLVSGLFVWPSLNRKGAWTFLSDRLLRIGVPFLLVAFLLMPVAHYPTYLQTATDPSIAAYWQHWLALPFWPCGPMWFLWLLLLWDIAAAGLYPLLARHRETVLRLSTYARQNPARFLAGFVLVSAIAYVPLALIFGPSAWFHRGPFSFQLSRPLHYVLYFFAGAAIGACGIERGLLGANGSLARHWAGWLAAAFASFVLWLLVMSQIVADPGAAPILWQITAALSFVLACFASCFLTLGASVRFAQFRTRLCDSLKDNAYGMYLIHYLFIVWLQFAMLATGLPAILKAIIVFAGTLALSWGATAGLRQVSAVSQIIGEGRRAAVASSPARRSREMPSLSD
ncbi:MAG: acyltransferase [Alphaproteobacteria bacterium]|nr:MAG: acyltransferase [Alphaproteobacteria bacterium]